MSRAHGIDRGTVQMRPRARLLNLVGEELISDEPVAVVELVKNAYDADVRAGWPKSSTALSTELGVADV